MPGLARRARCTRSSRRPSGSGSPGVSHPCVSAPTLRSQRRMRRTASSQLSSAELSPSPSFVSSSCRQSSRNVPVCFSSQAERSSRMSPASRAATSRSSRAESSCSTFSPKVWVAKIARAAPRSFLILGERIGDGDRLAELGEQDRFGERLGERSSSSGLSSAISGASTLAGIGAGSACQPASAARQRWPTARSAEGELSELSAPRDRTLWFGAWWGRSTRELALMCACACVRGHGHA